MTLSVVLTEELERFAQDCISTGRFADMDEVVAKALYLLRDSQNQRAQFEAMLDATMAEGDRVGFSTADEAFARIDALLGV